MAGLLSDSDIGLDAPASAPAPASGAATASAAQPAPPAAGLLSDSDIGLGAAPSSGGILSNDAGDSWKSGALKGAATAAVKGGSDILGQFGNVRDLADYLLAYGQSKVTGKPVDQIMAEHKALLAKEAQGDPLAQAGQAMQSAIPDSQTFSKPALAVTGEYKPTSLPGRWAQTGVEAAVGSLGPGSGAARFGEPVLGGIGPQAVGSVGGDLLKQTASQVPIMAALGAGTQAVDDATDSPMAGLLTGVALPALGGAAIHGATNLADKIVPLASRDEAKIGQRLLNAADDPEKFSADLQFQPDEVLPGSQLTTGQATGDLGILEAERAARTASGHNEEPGSQANPWNAREADQNAARTQALEGLSPADADPMKAADYFKAQMDALDQATEQAHNRIASGAQQMAASLDPGQDASLIGDQMRQAMQGANDVAQAHRDALYKAVDPDSTLTAVAEPARAAAEQIMVNHDPQYDAPIDPTVQRLADQLRQLPPVVPFSGLQALDRNISSAMMRERAASGFGNSDAYRQLTQLKSGVMDAINNAAENQAKFEAASAAQGDPLHDVPLAERMRVASQAFNDGGAGADSAAGAAERASGVASAQAGIPDPMGAGAPGLGDAVGAPGVAPGAAQSPLQAVAGRSVKPPPTLIDFLKGLGGIQDQGGEISTLDLGGPAKGLINPNGLPLDRAREAAAEAGYLGAETDRAMSGTTVNDLLSAINSHPTYSVHDYDQLADYHDYLGLKDDAAAYKQALQEVRDNFATYGMNPADRQLVSATARLMVQHNMPWDAAVESAARMYPRRPEPYTGNAFGGGRPADRIVVPPDAVRNPKGFASPKPELAPNFDAAATGRLADAKAAHADLAQTYRSGPVGDVLKSGPTKGTYRLPSAAVMGRAFAAGDKGYETAKTFLDAARGNRSDALQAMQDYALSKLTSRLKPDGTLDSAGLSAWKRQYAGALRALSEASPGWMQRASDAGKAGDLLVEAGLRRKAALKSYQESAAGKLIGKSSPDEVSAELGRIIADKANGPTRMQDLIAKARSNPDALDGLRRAATDWVLSKVKTTANAGTSGQPLLSSAAITKIVRDHGSTLGQLLGPEAVSTLRAVGEDVARAEQSVNATRVKGSPGTAKDSHPALKKIMAAAEHGGGLSAMTLGAYEAFDKGGIPAALAAAGLGGAGYLVKNMRSKGIRRLDDMFQDALLNPERARYYLSRVPAKSAQPPAWQNVGRMLQRDLIASNAAANNRLAAQ